MKFSRLLLCLAVTAVTAGLHSAPPANPPKQAVGFGEGFFGLESATDPTMQSADPAALRVFADERYGMFIHWGPVTLCGGELGWARGSKISAAEYDQLYRRFNPVKFDADEWARIAKEAGMRYVVMIAKHMDGFCLWDTKQTDYNIMNTPFHRDPLREMADACRRRGLTFGVYYCIADWYHPLFPFSGPYYGPKDTPIKPTADVERYTQHMMKQLAELVANYGPIQCMWFDSMAGAAWPDQGRRLVPFLRALQPSILVNNRAAVPGDYVTPEERIGRYRDDKAWESCMMIGTQWSWKPNDTLKSYRQLLRSLIYCAGGDGNLLLDVGPNAEGVIEAPTVARLGEIGAWLKQYGASIYGTRGGPYKPTTYLASTRHGNSVYLHILRWDSDRLELPPLPRKVIGHALLTGGTAEVDQTATAIGIKVPPANRQPIDTIVRLDLDGPSEGFPAIALPPEVTIVASATREPADRYAPRLALDADPDTEWSAPEGQTSATLELTFVRPRHLKSFKFDESTRPVRIRAYNVDWWNGQAWVRLLTVDHEANYLKPFTPITTQKLRLQIVHMEQTATVAEVVLGDANE